MNSITRLSKKADKLIKDLNTAIGQHPNIDGNFVMPADEVEQLFKELKGTVNDLKTWSEFLAEQRLKRKEESQEEPRERDQGIRNVAED